jgi:hypothetical protein
MDEYLLENWMQNNPSNDEGYYNCPCCDYALDLIEDDYGNDYVFCWNKCLYTEDDFLSKVIDAETAE